MSYENLHATAQQIYEKAVEVHMGDAYDWFLVNGRWQKFLGDDDQEEFDRLWVISQGEFAEVPGLFDEFVGMSNPTSYNDAIEAMQKVGGAVASDSDGFQDTISGEMYTFNTDLKDMTSAAEYMLPWKGLAMMEFRENFINKFSERTLNQFAACCVLTNALRAEQALWTESRLNIAKIAADGLNALDHTDDWGNNDWTMTFSIVGAVVAIGGLVVASGGTAAIALGAVAAGNGVASTWAGQREDEPEIPYSGNSARAVIDSLKSALQSLKDYIRSSEEKVESACQSAQGTLTSHAEDYVAPVPLLAGPNPDVGRPV